MLYVLNSLVIPVDFSKYSNVDVKLRRISVEEAKRLLQNNEFVSAIGHEGSAQMLSRLFNIPIPMNRVSVFFEPGDKGIHFFLKQRLPEGKVLNEQELKALDFWLVLSEVV